MSDKEHVQAQKTARIKEIESKLKSLRREKADTEPMVESMKKRLNTVDSEIFVLERQLDNMIPKELVVTDHAVLRWIERGYNIPIEEVRKGLVEKLKKFQNAGEVQAEGFVIRNNAVITYVPPETKLDNKDKI